MVLPALRVELTPHLPMRIVPAAEWPNGPPQLVQPARHLARSLARRRLREVRAPPAATVLEFELLINFADGGWFDNGTVGRQTFCELHFESMFDRRPAELAVDVAPISVAYGDALRRIAEVDAKGPRGLRSID